MPSGSNKSKSDKKRLRSKTLSTEEPLKLPETKKTKKQTKNLPTMSNQETLEPETTETFPSSEKLADASNSNLFIELSKMKTEIQNMKSSHTKELNILRETMQSQEADITSLKLDNKDLRERLMFAEGRAERSEKELADTKEEVMNLKDRSMRDNLLFFKIPEIKNETAADTRRILNEFLKNDLKIEDEIAIDRVHRIGPQKHDLYPRSIVAKFNPYKGKEIVLANTWRLKGTGKFITEQHPKPQIEKQRFMYETKKQILQENPEAKCNISKEKMTVNGKLVYPLKTPISNSDTVQDALDINLKNGPVISGTGGSYQVHLAKVKKLTDVKPALLKTCSDPYVAKATNNSFAFVIQNGARKYYDFQDDGDSGMGRTIRNTIVELDLSDTMIIISRWDNGRYDPEKWKLVSKLIKDKIGDT